MSKRRGAVPQQRRRRGIDAKRCRYPDRVRIFLGARLGQIFGITDSSEYRNALGAVTSAQARAYLKGVLDRDAADDPELYCCTPVSEHDSDAESF